MAEPRSTSANEIAELKSQVQALAERSRKSAAKQSKRLAVIEVVLVFMIVYFAWDYNSRFRPFETTGVFNGRTDIQEEIVNRWEGVKLNELEKAILGELAEAKNKITLLRQALYRLHKGSDAFRKKFNTITQEHNEEIASLQQNITVLRHQSDQLKWTLVRDLKVVKYQLKLKLDEAAFTSRTAVIRLESKQEMDRLEQNEVALKKDIELLTKEFNQLKENEQVRILERKFEKMKQQLEQKQDEAARVGAVLQQEMGYLKQDEEALKWEVELFRNKSASNYSLLLQEVTELSHLLQQEIDNDQVLEREFEKMKQQLKQTQEEASTATAALRQELVALLGDKQSKMAFQLEISLIKQEKDHIKQNQEALKQEVEFLRHEPASNCSLQEVIEPNQQEIEILKIEFEKLRQQLKQTQDMTSTALRQELVGLLRDKQSKTAFQLEISLMKQEMDSLKQNEEALKREIELLRHKPPGNCSLQVTKPNQQEIEILKTEFEKVKQQLKQTQDEVITAVAALRQQVLELHRDKQSKTAFQLESTLIKQKMDDLRQNEEALKREVELLRNKPPCNCSLKEVTKPNQQEIDHEILKKEFEKVKQQLKQTEDEVFTAVAALRQDVLDLQRDKQSKMAFQLESALMNQRMDSLRQNEEDLKQEVELLRNKTKPGERQQQIRKVQLEINQNGLAFQRNIEMMMQTYKSKAVSMKREMEELWHETQDLRKEAKQNQLNLSNVCSQISYSTTKEHKTELSTDLPWGLTTLMILAIIYYLTFSLYHQKYQSKIDAESQRIDQLTRKQEADRRSIDAQKGKLDTESQRIDQLRKKQEAHREQMAQDIDAQRIRMGLVKEKVYRFIEEQESSRKLLVQNIDALRLRQEHVRTVLAEQRLPGLLPFQITMPNFFKHKSAGDVWYSKPFYTDPRGYKMCLAVGTHVDEGKQVSICIYLMRGEFDDELMWPFRGKVVVYLLNQCEARAHHELTFNSGGNGNRVTEGERASIGIGEECIVPFRDLSYMYDTHTQYLKYDSLRFRVANAEIREDTVPVIPIDIIMTDFEGRKKDSEQWFGEPFYTNPEGYKMCLRVDSNGSDDGRGTHISVYVTLMQGEYDDDLKWPFRGGITIKLLNQERDEGHWEKTIPFDDRAEDDVAGRVTEWQGRARKGWGTHKFILHTKLSTRPGILKNNCLSFQVLKAVVKSR